MYERLLLFTIGAMVLGAVPSAGSASADERSGAEVVHEVCASCHATGINGAPRIGDARAWETRAARGLANLTDSAIKGIRNNRVHGGNPGQWRPNAEHAQWRPGDMPARGGKPSLTDQEIERAVRYMINRSSNP